MNVKGTDGAGLLRLMAQFAAMPVVSQVPHGQEALDIQASYEGWPSLLEDLTRRLGMTALRQDKLLVLRPSCTQLSLSPRGPESSRLISINFQYVQLTSMLRWMKIDAQVAPQDQVAFSRAALAVRVRDVREGDLLQAAAAAAGFRWAGNQQQGWRLERESADDCASSWTQTIPAKPALPSLGTINEFCPYRAPSPETTRRCSYLEQFALHSLQPKGYVSQRGHFKGVLESPDGLLLSVALGDYIGRDHGWVMKVDADGINVREIIQDETDEWVERARLLTYGEKPEPTLPIKHRREYIQPGSPQAAYDQLVTDLYQYTHQWISALSMCLTLHPGDYKEQRAAFDGWKARNAEAFETVILHNAAYAERAAADYSIPVKFTDDALRQNVDASTELAFKISGDLRSPAVREICGAQAQWLQNPHSDIAARFPEALKSLPKCTVDRTCPNLAY